MSSALGSRRVKNLRSKAHPDHFPDQGPVELRKAYEDLTPRAFAVWMRLHLESQDSLRSGRLALSKVVCRKERHFNAIMAELANKNYVALVPGGVGQPTELIINRRCVINARAGFVRLS